MTLYQPTFYIPKLKKSCIKRFMCRHVCHGKLSALSSSTRRPSSKRGCGTGKPVADEMTVEPKIDFRIQGIPHKEGEQDEEKSRKTIHWKSCECNHGS